MFVEISAVAWIFVEKSTTTIVQYTTFDERGKILLYFIGVHVVKWSARSRFAAEKPCARKMFEKKEREGSTSIIIEHMHRTKKKCVQSKENERQLHVIYSIPSIPLSSVSISFSLTLKRIIHFTACLLFSV